MPEDTAFPPQFSYLVPVLERYRKGLTPMVAQFDQFARGLTPADKATLAEAYLEIARREDSAAISDWLNTADRDARLKSELVCLLRLFERLGERKEPPFISGQVRHIIPSAPPPDWSKVPEFGQFLVPLARELNVQTDCDFDRAIDGLTPAGRRDLEAAAARCWNEDTYRKLDPWFRGLHTAAEKARIYFLFGLMDDLDLKFVAPRPPKNA